MRRAVLVLVFAASVCAANSQLTILPQAGIQNPTTKISYNYRSYFSPISQLQPQIGIRANYQLKNGFGPFISLSTSRFVVNYNFNDPENGMTSYNTSVGKTQLQLQAGVQYNSKPIIVKQTNSNTSKATSSQSSSNCQSYFSNCSRYSSSCCHKQSSAQKSKPQKQSWAMRIQPSAGFGYIPSNNPDLVTEMLNGQPSYTYNAGNLKTAFLTGVGFEFAKNKSKFLTVSINYFKGIGSRETTFTTQSSNKTTTTTLNSKVSGWNASIGIPISFSKRSSSTPRTIKEHNTIYDCQQHRLEHHYRCGRII